MLRRKSKINRERTINFLMIKWFIKFIFADHNPKIFLFDTRLKGEFDLNTIIQALTHKTMIFNFLAGRDQNETADKRKNKKALYLSSSISLSRREEFLFCLGFPLRKIEVVLFERRLACGEDHAFRGKVTGSHEKIQYLGD